MKGTFEMQNFVCTLGSKKNANYPAGHEYQSGKT